jgi:hypothetical protein
MFERKIICKIYGAAMENNMENNTLLKGEDIIRFIKSE